MSKSNLVHIVVTISSCAIEDGGDNYGDILMVTLNKKKALDLKNKVKTREPIPGLNYELLQDFDSAEVITLPMNEPVQNVDMDQIGFHSWFAKKGNSSKLKQHYNTYLGNGGTETFGFWVYSYYMDNLTK
jgi:hypothetical protein